MNYSFTYIIGYRHTPDRLNNLRRSLDWINCFAGVDVIVVEQDSHSKISHLNLRCRHIFLKSKDLYNRSWAFNVGTKYAKSNVIVFSDSDLLMDPNKFIEGLKSLERYEMVNPYSSVVDLDPRESSLPLEEITSIERAGRGENDHQKVPLCGGICMFRKDAINKIGGWNEDFIGWGGEDDFQTIKVKNFLTHIELPNKCYHLFHNRTQPDMTAYQRTLQLLQTLSNLSKEDLVKYINKSIGKNGMKNSHDDYTR